MTSKRLVIDPPAGWRYGFPKIYDNDEGLPLEVWLLENGYPQKEIDAGGASWCRYWETEEEE
jgi:hypothetical protein